MHPRFNDAVRHSAKLFIYSTILMLAASCAHQINISPPLESLENPDVLQVTKNVAYYISEEDLAKEVTTPAGGGDKVRYFPYKESEPALRKVLDDVFDDVYKLPSREDVEFMESHDITYVFIPTIDTNSVGRSSVIWPPADFTMTLDCTAVDPTNQLLWHEQVVGEAHLALSSVHFDHSRAAREAVQDAFSKLQDAILQAGMFE